MLLVYAVDEVTTSSSRSPNCGSADTWRRYFCAPSAGVQRNVGCVVDVDAATGSSAVGGNDSLLNVCGL